MAHYFVMEELQTELSQSFEVTRALGLRIKSVRPYIYLQGTVAGTFRVAIFYNSVEVATTATFTAADIRASISTAHTYCAVNYFASLTSPVFLPKGEYEIKIISSGYTYSTNDFIAWIIEHEDSRNQMSYTPANDLERSFSFDLYRY